MLEVGVLVVLAAILIPFGWHTDTVGFMSDGAVYLMMADYLSPFSADKPAVAYHIMQHTRFPPLYPLTLALGGGGSAAMAQAHLVTCLTLLAAGYLYYHWLCQETAARLPAAILSITFICLPSTLFLATELWSEFLYLSWVFGFFLLSGRQTTERSHYLALAGVVAAAVLTRAVGLTLLVVFIVYLRKRRVANMGLYLLIALGPALAWLGLKHLLGAQGSYLHSLAGVDNDSLATLIRRSLEFHSAWLRHLSIGADTGGPQVWLAGLLGLLALSGLARRLWHGKLDAWFVLLNLALLLLWPFPAHLARLTYPLLPFLLFYGLETSGRLSPHLRYGVPLIVILLVTPTVWQITHRYLEPPPEAAPSYRHTRYWLREPDRMRALADVTRRHELIQFLRGLRQHVPEGECLYAPQTPIVMLYTQRVSWRYPDLSGEAALAREKLNRCRYALVWNFGVQGHPPLHPLLKLRDSAEIVTASRRADGTVVGLLMRLNSTPSHTTPQGA